MENPFPPHATSLGGGFTTSSNFGMPSLTSTQEPKDPFHNTTLGNDDEEVYQEENLIDHNNIPNDVQIFLANPYNVEMMEKYIKANKIEIFLNLVKDGVNVSTRFDEATLFRQIMKGGAPVLPNPK